jgi:hypothetical protein
MALSGKRSNNDVDLVATANNIGADCIDSSAVK